MDIKAVMLRKAGPMPVWAWTALAGAFIGGYVFFMRGKTPTPSGGTNAAGTTGPAGEFSSGQTTTTTDPVTGNQITSQYNATGPLTGFPGMMTTQAGAMPYSGGDVYVNYPNQPGAPPQQMTNTNPDGRTRLDTSRFTAAGAGNSPWMMEVAQPGETWEDITARTYHFAKDFASVKDPASVQRVKDVAAWIKMANAPYTGTVPDGTGPTPGAVVVYH